ncbi:cyanoexosortase A [Roseofilum sp. BLCC_M143]|uniref:Cyanoexosortase A n=2 Tax=Roseofilum TaxID=1233426 RepID=A0ABT7BWE3_9CYAN|nr:cyanoexosortase A [Roseofilum casamattae BLCC-M143]
MLCEDTSKRKDRLLQISIQPKFWVLGIAVSLMSVYLNLIWKVGSYGWLNNNLIFWIAIVYLLWNKRNKLQFNSGMGSAIAGTAIVALGLLKSTHITGPGPVLNALPFIYILGLVLLASGVRGLHQYWQELLLFFIWSFPKLLLVKPLDAGLQISELTAKSVSFILWYLGFNVDRQGVTVHLPTGGITITSECAGILTMFWLVQIALIFLMIFPNNWLQKIGIPLLAILIGFSVNVFRLSLLAFFVSDRELFHYWHSGDGSGIFRIVCILAFGLLCWFCVQEQPESEEFQEL